MKKRMILKYQYTRDLLTWIAGNGDPMHKVCIPQRVPRAWECGGDLSYIM